MKKSNWEQYVARAEHRRRIAASLAATLMLLTILLSITIIVKNAHHDCTGSDCSVCAQTADAVQRLSGCGGKELLPAAALLVCFSLLLRVPLPRIFLRYHTPVTLKVQLLN